jgi:ABC-type transport system involved in multi-copper enzyme maturation permease subunit
MVAKELRDARWKVLAALAVVLTALTVSGYPTPYPLLVEMTEVPPPTALPDGTLAPEEYLEPSDPEEYAMQEMAGVYNVGGFVILLPLAGVLGVALIAGETGSGTIFTLLSKPVSRTRVLLTKYVVCAVALLACAVFGGVLLVIAAAVRGYPLENLNVAGAALSSVLIWLGSLFVLGVALLASVVFRNVLASAIATALAMYLVFALPSFALSIYFVFAAPEFETPAIAAEVMRISNLGSYWVVEGLYVDGSVPLMNFLFSFAAAAIMLLVSLWLFRRKGF